MANKQRGYITLKLGGKNRTLHFSMNFWAQWTDMLGVSLEQIGGVFENGISLKGVRSLIYSGVLTYDQENGNEVDYNEFTVGTWLDDLEADKLEEIINAMLESRILGNDLNMGVERKAKRTTKGEGK
jgi:hypothetical protein